MNKKHLIHLSFIILCLSQADLSASHIVGGLMRYECLGQTNNQASFQIYCSVYRDSKSGGSDCEDVANFGLYRQTANGDWEFVDLYQSDIMGDPNEIIGIDYPCLEEPIDEVGVESCEYSFSIEDIDIINQSYMIAYQKCCRNASVLNIFDPELTGIALTNVISPLGQQLCNTNPVFDELPPIFICGSYELSLFQSATDADGDELRYSFCDVYTAGGDVTGNPGACNGISPNPQNCLPPFDVVSLRPQYTSTTPLGGNPTVKIDPATGLMTGVANTLGRFLVGVCVEEYRNGVKIGEIIRDFQFNVEDCQPEVYVDIDIEQVGDKQFYYKSCGEQTVDFKNQSGLENNIENYFWSFNLGGEMITNDQRDWTLTFPDYGNYQGQMIINEGLFCADTAFISVDIFPPVEAALSVEFDSCLIAPIHLIDETDSPFSSIVDWTWEVDGQIYEMQFPEILLSTSGNYEIELRVEDDNACKDTANTTISYHPVPTDLSLGVSAFKSCAPSLISFEELSGVINKDYTVLWDFGDGEKSAEVSPVHEYNTPGIYTISLEVESLLACQNTGLFEDYIQVLESPLSQFSYTPQDLNAINNLVEFNNESQESEAWEWRFNEHDYSSKEHPSFEFVDTGIYEVQLVSFHANGCTDTIKKTLNIKPLDFFYFPNAFTPNFDGKNETFRGLGEVQGMSDFRLQIWNRWGELVFETADSKEGWDGRKNNIGQKQKEGIFVYQYRFLNARNEEIAGKGKVLLLN